MKRPIALVIVLSALVSVAASNSVAAQKPPRATAQQAAKTAQDQVAFIAKTRAALEEGHKKFTAWKLYTALKAFADDNDEKNKAMGGGNKDGKPTAPEIAPLHVQFVADTKDALRPEAKQFIQSFKKPEDRGRASDLVAQWMTALDAIGQGNDQEETSKFTTLANKVELELL